MVLTAVLILLKLVGCLIVAVLALLFMVGTLFNDDICEDDENDKVSRYYGGDE